MQLDAYLRRIQYNGPRTPNSTTLCELHRAHLRAIPYENLDIHLGRPLSLDLAQIYAKLVEQRRGGWCYEMNGLLAWALQQLGFSVTLLGSRVGAPAAGTEADQDHLLLLVELEQPWLADVGFGNGFFEPLPLVAGEYQQDFFTFRLEQQGDRWYFHNQKDGGPGYGFTLLPRQLAGFASRCHELQTSPASGFVRATVCHRYAPEGVTTLRGALLRRYTRNGMLEEEITSHQRYGQVLQASFDLQIEAQAELWTKVWARHLVWKQENA